MNAPLLYAAALAAVLCFSVHFFVGGRFVAAPLLANTQLPAASKWLNYYCWHVTSLYIFALIGAFAWAGWTGQGRPMVTLLTLLNGSFALLSAAVAHKGGIAPLRFPSTSLFALLALLGGSALVF